MFLSWVYGRQVGRAVPAALWQSRQKLLRAGKRDLKWRWCNLKVLTLRPWRPHKCNWWHCQIRLTRFVSSMPLPIETSWILCWWKRHETSLNVPARKNETGLLNWIIFSHLSLLEFSIDGWFHCRSMIIIRFTNLLIYNKRLSSLIMCTVWNLLLQIYVKNEYG